MKQMKKMSKLSALLLGTTIALMQVSILGCTKSAVTKIAKEITVTIDGCSSGSGVIFNVQYGPHRHDNTYHSYHVLTANHVVKTNQEFCRVITPDGVRHSPNTANIKPIEGVDLAVIQFDSSNLYKVGILGNSRQVDIGTTVYVAGVPASSDEVPIRTLRVSPGEIIGIPPQAPEGYTLIYNNTTRGGMSGGPILGESGAIVGIHGKGNPSGGIKENYGIPIEKIKQAHEKIKQAQKISEWKSRCGVGVSNRFVLVKLVFFWLGWFGWGLGLIFCVSVCVSDLLASDRDSESRKIPKRKTPKWPTVLCLIVGFWLSFVGGKNFVFYRSLCDLLRDTGTVEYKWHSREKSKKLRAIFLRHNQHSGDPIPGTVPPSSGRYSERGVSVRVEREE